MKVRFVKDHMEWRKGDVVEFPLMRERYLLAVGVAVEHKEPKAKEVKIEYATKEDKVSKSRKTK